MSDKKNSALQIGRKEREAYKRRHALRLYALMALVPVIALFAGYRTVQSWWIGGSVVGHVILLMFGLGITGGIWWLLESQDPDPDPEAAKIEAEQSRIERSKAAEIRSAEKLVRRDQHVIERAEQQARKAENAAVKASEDKIKNAAAAEHANALVLQQIHLRMQSERSNRITELIMLFESNPKKALKLAQQEGIDLHAEALARVNAGVGSIAFALGAGAQAGSEFVKGVIRKQ